MLVTKACMCRCLYTCATLCTHNPCKVSPTIHRPSLHVGDKKHHNLSRNTRGKGESCRTRAIDLNESQVHRANRKPNHDTFTIFGGRNKYAQVLILCQCIDSSLSSKEINLASSELSCASFSKRGQVHNLSYENEFYMWMKTHFHMKGCPPRLALKKEITPRELGNGLFAWWQCHFKRYLYSSLSRWTKQ